MTSTAARAAPAISDADQARCRILRVLVASRILSDAGLAAGVTGGALLAQDMLGSTSLAGLPSALFTAVSALAAVAVAASPRPGATAPDSRPTVSPAPSADSAERLAACLPSQDTQLTVLSPKDVREAHARRAQTLLTANR